MARVARIEGTREVIAYLSEKGCLGNGLNWDALDDAARETWVGAITERFSEVNRTAARSAIKELAEWEELAMLLPCRRCGADEEEPCRDLRRNFITHIKHPHAERMEDMEAD